MVGRLLGSASRQPDGTPDHLERAGGAHRGTRHFGRWPRRRVAPGGSYPCCACAEKKHVRPPGERCVASGASGSAPCGYGESETGCFSSLLAEKELLGPLAASVCAAPMRLNTRERWLWRWGERSWSCAASKWLNSYRRRAHVVAGFSEDEEECQPYFHHPEP